MGPTLFIACMDNMEIFNYPIRDFIITTLRNDLTPDGDKTLLRSILTEASERGVKKSTFEVVQQFKKDNSPDVIARVLDDSGEDTTDSENSNSSLSITY